MLVVVVMTVLCVLVAGLVLTYVAFPHRGRQVPRAPWLGEWMRRRVDALPRVAEDEEPLIGQR